MTTLKERKKERNAAKALARSVRNTNARNAACRRHNERVASRRETNAILADADTMAAIAEAEAES